MIDKFSKISKSLVGKHVLIKHNRYPEIVSTRCYKDNDYLGKLVIRKVFKIPNTNTKQICFSSNHQPILIRKGDKFTIEIISGISTNNI
ncbi:unnamed protein product [marine sediment metagenome]|uniref:Uncharacterized protein n=1 Tax=marine sediment metagenome TaxID=412755 RepID=X0V3Y2_9ZZZZ